MGAFLDAPITEKKSEHGSNQMVSWGAVGMQGWRCSMEDTHIADEVDLPDGTKGMLFGVFDGHGGHEVAQFAKDHFTQTFKEKLKSRASDFE